MLLQALFSWHLLWLLAFAVLIYFWELLLCLSHYRNLSSQNSNSWKKKKKIQLDQIEIEVCQWKDIFEKYLFMAKHIYSFKKANLQNLEFNSAQIRPIIIKTWQCIFKDTQMLYDWFLKQRLIVQYALVQKNSAIQE